MNVVQEYLDYCEVNRMPALDTGTAVFFAASRDRTGARLSTEEWDDVMDVAAPYMPADTCPFR